MNPTMPQFHAQYDPGLVVLSTVVAVIASYGALDLAGRVRATTGRIRFG